MESAISRKVLKRRRLTGRKRLTIIMLPKQYRISSKDMRLVLQRGRFLRFKGLKLVVLSLPMNDSPKIGFIVSMRTEKKAVTRHQNKAMFATSSYVFTPEFLPSYGYVLVVDQNSLPFDKNTQPYFETNSCFIEYAEDMKKLVLSSIRFYQRFLSLDTGILAPLFTDLMGTATGSLCRFTPRCSRCSYEAVNTYGILYGLYLG